MKVGRRPRHRLPGEMAPRVALAVDRVGVGGLEIGREMREGDARAAVPVGSASFRLELDRQITRDELAAARERKSEEVAVRAELELEIAIVPAEQEELDDLVVPEPIAASGGRRRRRIAVVGGLDFDLDRLFHGRADG